MLTLCLLILLLPASVYKNGYTTPVSAHIYLSFDDGPVSASRVVQELVNRDTIPVNMFIIGKYVYKNDTMRILFDSLRSNPGIEIGNHSYTHANRHYRLFYSNTLTAVQDVLLNVDTLQLTNALVRLPGRNMWRLPGKTRSDGESGQAVADSLASLGYTLFGWDIEWQTDSCGRMNRTADEMMTAIEHILHTRQSFTPGHVVVLFHDAMMGSPYNYQQFQLFIEKIKANKSYRLSHLSQYPVEQRMVTGARLVSTDQNQKRN